MLGRIDAGDVQPYRQRGDLLASQEGVWVSFPLGNHRHFSLIELHRDVVIFLGTVVLWCVVCLVIFGGLALYGRKGMLVPAIVTFCILSIFSGILTFKRGDTSNSLVYVTRDGLSVTLLGKRNSVSREVRVFPLESLRSLFLREFQPPPHDPGMVTGRCARVGRDTTRKFRIILQFAPAVVGPEVLGEATPNGLREIDLWDPDLARGAAVEGIREGSLFWGGDGVSKAELETTVAHLRENIALLRGARQPLDARDVGGPRPREVRDAPPPTGAFRPFMAMRSAV